MTLSLKHAAGLTIARLVLIAMMSLIGGSSGCQQLRLPAIDPTGACVFAPRPTTTTLALPGSGGERCGCFGCLNKIGTCFKNHKFTKPVSAFPEPLDPPECATPAGEKGGCLGGDEVCVPSQNCDGQCAAGPRAVLIGKEIDATCPLHLPERGKRGCILLTPQRIVAPVGGEVVLLSGICGDDGYLQVNESLEWMLTNDSVGTIIDVGDDELGAIHRFAGAKQPDKRSPSYALGVTSSKKQLITRGNLNPRDDVSLEKGQTWVTLSSPSEGTSRITVLAPDSECWDQRKATATIYWIDARWQFPSPQIVPAGTQVALSTRVTRSEGTLPARGWRVRYEIMNPELATFAGATGSSVVEVNVDDNGLAPATLIPTPGKSGVAAINMQVIRPGGDRDNMPTMTIGNGQTFVTWSSPQLAIRAGAPSTATYDLPVEIVANVSNPGDQPAENVKVTVQLPPGTVALADNLAKVYPNSVEWDLGTLPPQTQIDLFMSLPLKAPSELIFQARANNDLFAEDSVRIDVYRPSLSVTVSPEKDRYETGQPVNFRIAVLNTGDRPLDNVRLEGRGDGSMVHNETGGKVIENTKTDGPLQPGATWNTAVTFVPTNSGRRCINVQATADGGQRGIAESCVTVINPIPPTPSLTATLQGRERIPTGTSTIYRARVVNTGEVPLSNVRVAMSFDPQLTLLQATEGKDTSRLGQYIVSWNIPTLARGESKVLEGEFEATRPNPRSQVVLTVTSAQGAAADADFFTEIFAGPPPTTTPTAPPSLPQVLPTPTIPQGAAPQPTVPPRTQPAQPNAIPNTGRGPRLELINRDNPVQVGRPIRYALRISNESAEIDSRVGIRFKLPSGVRVDSINQRLNPGGVEIQESAGMIYLSDIRTMRPGESIDYDIVLISNQPQAFDLNVEAISQQSPGGVSASASTQVLP